MIKFSSKTKASAKVQMSSSADIIFLLLIFFMTVTVFKEFQGLKVQLPAAKATKKIEGRRQVAHIWINTENRINIDDMIMPMNQVAPTIKAKMIDDPALIISLHTDENVRYRKTAQILEQLKKAQALRINFGTRAKE